VANRSVSNVIIVDSAFVLVPIINTISNSVGHLTKMHVNAIAFCATDTTGFCSISCGNDTSNVIARFSWIGGGPAMQSTQFGQNQPLEDIRVPLLSGGTAWIYLA